MVQHHTFRTFFTPTDRAEPSETSFLRRGGSDLPEEVNVDPADRSRDPAQGGPGRPPVQR